LVRNIGRHPRSGPRELQTAGLLSRRFKTVENWLSPVGTMTICTFQLKGPSARPTKRHRTAVPETPPTATAAGA